MKSTTETNNNAVAYIRVSTEEQDEKRNSPEEQIRAAHIYAKNHNLELKMIFREAQSAYRTSDNNLDKGISRILCTDRPELHSLLKHVEREKPSHLIVYTRDRLSRNVEESIAIKALLNNLKVNIHFSRPGEYSNQEESIYDNFLEIILSSIAELESNVLSTRVTMGSRVNTEHGFWNGGKAPFGYTKEQNSRKKQMLTPYYIEQAIVKEIYNYYTKYGYGYRKIADLIKQKYSDFDYGIKWSKNTIEWILNNENYTGKLIWGRRSNNKMSHSTNSVIRSTELNNDAVIVDDLTWSSKCEIAKTKQSTKDPKYFDTPFLLKGKLICGTCKKELMCKNYGTGKSVYRCPTLNGRKTELMIEISDFHKIFLDKLQSLFTFEDDTINHLWSLYLIKSQKLKLEKTKLIGELEKNAEESLIFLEQLNNIKSQFSTKQISEKKPTEDYSNNIDDSLDMDQLELNTKKSKNETPIDVTPTRIKTIRESIEEQIVKQYKKTLFYQQQLETINKNSIPRFNSKTEFSDAFNNLFNNFSNLKETNQRIILDLLIDKVIINKAGCNLSLDIIIKTSRL